MVMRVGSLVCFSYVVLACLYPDYGLAAVTEASKIPQKEICRSGKVSPADYMNWVYDNYGVKRKCTGTDPNRQISLLTDPDVDTNLCAGILQAQNLTGLLISQSSKSYRPEVMVEDTSANRALFLRGKLKVQCVAAAAPEGKGNSEAVAEAKSALIQDSLPPPFHLRIRNSQDDLRYDQGTAGFKKAGGAKFSVTRDTLAGTTEYYTKGVIGLDTGERFIGDHTFRLTPYFTGERKTNTNPGTSGDIDKLGGGLIADFDYSPLNGPLHFGLSIDPQFLTDSIGRTQIWGGNLRLAPALMLPGNNIFPGGRRTLGPITYDFDLNYLGRYSNVVDSGGRPELSLSKTYAYGGPEFKLALAGADGTWLDRISMGLSYYNLYRYTGQYDRIEMFMAELKYALDAAGLFQLALSYQNGRDVEQFVKQEGWNLTLTYKY